MTSAHGSPIAAEAESLNRSRATNVPIPRGLVDAVGQERKVRIGSEAQGNAGTDSRAGCRFGTSSSVLVPHSRYFL